MNKMVLTYISEVVGFLCKLIHTAFVWIIDVMYVTFKVII